MSQYNTAQETTAKAKTLTKADKRGDYIIKADTSANHESILRNLFNALFVSERQHSVKTDHTPNHPTIMMLDINQVQQLINAHCGKLITHMEIIDALYDLEEPKLLMPSTVVVESEIDGQRINAIRLDYGKPMETTQPLKSETDITESISETTQTFRKLNDHLKDHIEVGKAFIKSNQGATKSETDNLAKELSRVDLTLHSPNTADQLDSPTQSEQSYQSTTVELREQQIVDRDTIRSLRGIIIDMAETLHVADPDARISMTSSDLLDLINSQNDMSDNAF